MCVHVNVCLTVSWLCKSYVANQQFRTLRLGKENLNTRMWTGVVFLRWLSFFTSHACSWAGSGGTSRPLRSYLRRLEHEFTKMGSFLMSHATGAWARWTLAPDAVGIDRPGCRITILHPGSQIARLYIYMYTFKI
jgi:hypothetical protein